MTTSRLTSVLLGKTGKFLILFSIIVSPVFGQSETTPVKNPASSPDPDTSQVLPKKLESHSTWEKVVSFPGEVVFSPFDLLLSGAARGAAYAHDIKLPIRIKELFYREWGGLYPIYVSHLGAGAELSITNREKNGPEFNAVATRGLRGRGSYSAGLERLSLLGGAISSDFILGYNFFSDDDFFGIGPESQKSDKSNYALERSGFEAAIRTELSEKVRLNLLFGLESNRAKKGRDTRFPFTTDLYTSATLPGIDERIRIARFGLQLRADSRNHPGNPSSGGEHVIGWGLCRQVGGDRFAWWKAEADLKRYVNLFYNRVLVLRLAAQVTEPFSGYEIPFFHLSEIGRMETIRGYDRGRFRDRDKLICTLEYRYPVWRKIDCELFLDAGQVSPDLFSQLSLNDFKYGYGFGFRFWSQTGLGAKIELGKSNDKYRLYIVLNE